MRAVEACGVVAQVAKLCTREQVSCPEVAVTMELLRRLLRLGEQMKIQRYDQSERLRQMSRLSREARAAFALLCATRLLPQYRRFYDRTGQGEPARLEELAKKLWQHLLSGGMSPEKLQHGAEQCLRLVPPEEDGWEDDTQALAEDAGSALAYAYRAAATGDARYAVWASRRLYDAMDYFVSQCETGCHYDEDGRLQHPMVQAELRRQTRDAQDLMQFNQVDELRKLCSRAEREADHLLKVIKG